MCLVWVSMYYNQINKPSGLDTNVSVSARYYLLLLLHIEWQQNKHNVLTASSCFLHILSCSYCRFHSSESRSSPIGSGGRGGGKTVPDRPFHNFRTSKSVDRCARAVQSSSVLVKRPVGWRWRITGRAKEPGQKRWSEMRIQYGHLRWSF